MTTKANKGGRPPVMTRELEDEICKQIAEGKSLVSILKSRPGMPDYTTVTRHLRATKGIEDGFCHRYARAREDQADYLFDEILQIADDGSKDKFDFENVQRSRLRVDTRKWAASKLKPKRYGDSTTIKGDSASPLSLGVIMYPPKKTIGEK
jgi:hypothetical protein